MGIFLVLYIFALILSFFDISKHSEMKKARKKDFCLTCECLNISGHSVLHMNQEHEHLILSSTLFPHPNQHLKGYMVLLKRSVQQVWDIWQLTYAPNFDRQLYKRNIAFCVKVFQTFFLSLYCLSVLNLCLLPIQIEYLALQGPTTSSFS